MAGILYILQNGYHSDKYKFKNRREWSRDLNNSFTGKRLLEMIPEDHDYFVINSTPVVGVDVYSCLEPDLKYIRTWLTKVSPDVVCACGRIAQSACEALNIDFVPAPHPAWRQLSKQKTNEIKTTILEKIKCN